MGSPWNAAVRLSPGAWVRAHAVPLAFVMYGACYVLWLGVAPATEATHALVGNLGYLPLGLASAFIAWRVSQTAGLGDRPRSAWRLVAAACVLTLAANIWWAVDANVRGMDPSESWSNLLHLLYYPTLLAGLLLLPNALRSRRDAATFGLDAATVLVGGGMVVWYFVIAPTVTADRTSTFAWIVSLCYPVGDLLLLLGIATILLRCPRGARRWPMMLLTAALTANILGDLVWAHLALAGDVGAGGAQDVPYMAFYVLLAMGIAAEQQRLRRNVDDEDEAATRPFSALPYLAVVTGYGLLVGVAWPGTEGTIFQLIVGSVTMACLVVARQIVTVRENLRLRRERAVLASEARFRSLVQHASDIVSIIDTDWTIVFVSPAVTGTLGHQPSEIVGRSLLDILHPDDTATAVARLKEGLADPMLTGTVRCRFSHTDNSWVPTETICTNLMEDENVRGMVLNTRDISERCALEAQLMHQAFHDPLTGLANRALFQDRVGHSLARRRPRTTTTGVLFVDLDHFKTVNDSLGHAVGDQLLEAAARRLVGSLREFDTAARLGGDEFAVLIEDAQHADEVTAIAERIAQAFLEPFSINGREIVSSASIGVALADNHQSVEDLLRNADLAMYLAKGLGRGRTALFEPAMHTAVLSRLELDSDLRNALQRQEFTLAYQPIHALDTGALIGAEALLRWTHPTRGPLSPASFIPLAEDTGLIVPIGRWALSRACADGRAWQLRQGSGRPFRMSVNLSGRQVPEPSLVEDVETALRESGLPPSSLLLELTESVLLERTEEALAVMNRLKALGVRLAIDDFGTGYSSLSYLQRLPIDVLKIDRAFVDRIEKDAGAAGLARAIVGLGKTLSLQTVGEGIEQPEQAEILRALGCDYGQGYYFGRPMTFHDLLEYSQRLERVDAA